MPDYVDIHSHVNFAAYDEDRNEAVENALKNNVWMINVGTQKDTSRSAIKLAEKYQKGVYASIGLHPIHTSKSFHDEKELGTGNKDFTSRGEYFDKMIYQSIASHPKVVAIGECGLDYYRLDGDSFKKQEEAFKNQIELSIEVKKPLMLHLRSGSGRSAYNDAFSILKPYLEGQGILRGNLHFFAGSFEEAKPFLDSGFSLSFTGVITFARDYDKVIKNIPLNRIMSETDCPYVSPVPFRGKRNEPLYVREVVKKIAEIRNENFEKVKLTLAQNAVSFFSLM